jgi:GAF domain-containing protein
LGSESVFYAPIVFENETFGILVVGDISGQDHPTQTDLNLLTGIGSQVALKIKESLSFQLIQQSEERYRRLYSKSKQEEEVYRLLKNS